MAYLLHNTGCTQCIWLVHRSAPADLLNRSSPDYGTGPLLSSYIAYKLPLGPRYAPFGLPAGCLLAALQAPYALPGIL